MKRKRPEERVARFRAIRPGNLPNIKRQCIRWAQDDLITLRDAALEVSVPEGLNDRAADNWEPLLTIADRVGGEWPDRARKAALALSGKGAAEDGSIGVMLLGDIRAIFERRALEVSGDLWTRIPSKELAEKLAEMEGRPWADWKGKPLTKNSLARLLDSFCIRPKDLRFGQRNASGYELSTFADAFARYLPPEPSPATPTTPTQLNSKGNLQTSTPTKESVVGVEKSETVNGNKGVGDVGVENTSPPENGKDRGEDDDDGAGDADRGAKTISPVFCAKRGRRESW
jgi:putative DNA primase/helicase